MPKFILCVSESENFDFLIFDIFYVSESKMLIVRVRMANVKFRAGKGDKVYLICFRNESFDFLIFNILYVSESEILIVRARMANVKFRAGKGAKVCFANFRAVAAHCAVIYLVHPRIL